MLRWGKGKAEAEAPPKQAAIAQAPAKAQQAPSRAASTLESPAAPKRTSLAELLLSERKVTEEQAHKALERQAKTGEFLGEILIEQGLIDENSLLAFLAKHCKVPHLSLLDYLIDEEVLALVPKELCLKYRVIPIDKLGRNLTVAMVNPLDGEALEQVQLLNPDLRIKPILCTHQHFEHVTGKLFKVARKGGAVELTASSFGLTRAPGAKVVPVEAPAEEVALEPPPPPPAPPPPPKEEALPVEEIPDAVEIEVAAPAEVAVEAPALQAAPVAGEPEIPEEAEDAVIEGVFDVEEDAPSAPVEAKQGGGEALGMLSEMATAMMDSMRDTYAILARRMELFQGLSPEDVARIFSRSLTVECAEGDVVFSKGDPGEKMYVILGGEVSIFDGDREIARLTRGDMFGEMALVSNEARSASARAVSSTSLLALSLSLINEIMPREVAIQLLVNIVVTLSERLRLANEK